MWCTKSGTSYLVYTKVTVVNSSGAPVKGAIVYLQTMLPSGSTISNSGATSSDGTVTLSVKSKQRGTYRSDVSNVTHDAYIYDAASSITSASYTVP
jgi:hypothetical protein